MKSGDPFNIDDTLDDSYVQTEIPESIIEMRKFLTKVAKYYAWHREEIKQNVRNSKNIDASKMTDNELLATAFGSFVVYACNMLQGETMAISKYGIDKVLSFHDRNDQKWIDMAEKKGPYKG